MFGAYFEYRALPLGLRRRPPLRRGGRRPRHDCRGNPLPLAKSSILASNGYLHEAMLAVVKPRFPGDG